MRRGLVTGTWCTGAVLRTRRRWACGALVLGAVSFGAASAAAQSPVTPPIDLGAVAQGHIDQALRAAARATPPRRAARLASRSAYRGLGRDSAVDLARRTFREELTGEIPSPGQVPAGTRLGDFVNDNWARVSDRSGGAWLAHSILPMRAGPAGDKRLVDLGLSARGDEMESANPLAQVSYGSRASMGVSLSERGVTVRPRADRDVSGWVREDRVYFAGVARDADEIVAPSASGFRVMWQLRSPMAPTDLAMRFDLPAGARLRAVDVRGAAAGGIPDSAALALQVVRGGRVLASVRACVDGRRRW